MVEYKVIVDTLASLAALVAIVTALAGWYRSARRPLRVTRVVVHRAENETTFILVIRNVKPYPVTVQRADCYRRKKYQVQKKRGGKPEYAELFPGSEQLFGSRPDCDIAANGHTDVRIPVSRRLDVPSKLLFLLDTSHGYHELWCKDVMVVEMGRVELYGLEYNYDYASRFPAKMRYYWKVVVELTKRCGRHSH